MESPSFFQTMIFENFLKTDHLQAKEDEFRENFLDFLINFHKIPSSQFDDCFSRNWQLLKPALQKKLVAKLNRSYSIEEISLNVLLYMY